MASVSDIEWTDASWTPIRARNLKTGKVGWHCEHVTPGCVNCYAEGMNKRLGTGLPFKPGHRSDIEIFLDQTMLFGPLKWRKPRMIFVCSMTDLFADFVPDEWIDKMFAVMALAPHHTFQVLTKRAERMRNYFAAPGRLSSIADHVLNLLFNGCGQGDGPSKLPLSNVWLGVSAEDQQRANERIPHLIRTPAAVRFISAEPLHGPIDLTVPDIALGCGAAGFTDLDWVIVGGESGRGARPMHPSWARGLRDQCKTAGVYYFFKQWGEWGPLEHSAAADEAGWQGRGDWMILDAEGRADLPDRRWPDEAAGETAIVRVGKKAAGRLLDGVEHNEMPGRAA